MADTGKLEELAGEKKRKDQEELTEEQIIEKKAKGENEQEEFREEEEQKEKLDKEKEKNVEKIHPKAIVLDIEGTVCPISFVKDILFPFAVNKIHSLVADIPSSAFPLSTSSTPAGNTNHILINDYLLKFPEEYIQNAQSLLNHIDDLVKRDVKASYLKTLQGYLWKSGYESGEIKAPIYSDAISHIRKWSQSLESGVYIYSSGSVAAQILLFAHSANDNEENGPSIDLTSYLNDYFDTVNAGQKTETESYKTISSRINISPNDILFFTDNPKEIDAALEAGWKTVLVVRPGNAPFDDIYKTRTAVISNFNEIDIN